MLLLLQIAVILTFSRAMRWVLAPLRQPAVIAEMVAGLMLGPSCFGWIAPTWARTLFPAAGLEPLNALSQVGLVLFMFLVGLRVRLHAAIERRTAAAVTSAVSIVVPFTLGVGLASVLHERLAPAGVGLLPFALFIGAAMSITAFPVLARILADHQLFATDIGALAITCAAFDDVSGWMILAGILSILRGGQSQALAAAMGLLIVYLAVMLFVVRPLLRAWYRRRTGSADHLALALIVALLSATTTDALGVHALFGAFFAGLMMPGDADLEATLTSSLEPVAMTLLLPLFFAFTGLRTSVRLIDSPSLWTDTALVLAVAMVGKGGASAVAARLTGSPWREASVLGVLLNTRGLIELVILNIGLEAGILSPLAFSMLVMMALVTTFITSPLLHLLLPANDTKPVRPGSSKTAPVSS